MNESNSVPGSQDYNHDSKTMEFLFENAPLGIALIDREGYYIKVNQSFALGLGYDKGEVKGMHFRDITCPLFVAATRFNFSKIVKREIKSFCIRKQYFKRDGAVLDASVDVFSNQPQGSDPPYYFGFYRISKPFYEKYFPMVHTELLGLIKKTPVPGVLISNQTGQLLFSSRVAANLLRYTEIELYNKSLTDILDSNEAGALFNLIRGEIKVSVLECELKFHPHGNGILCVKSQIFVDNTNYFRNGRMLIIVFKEEPVIVSLLQTDYADTRSQEPFLEIGQIRDTVNFLSNDNVKNTGILKTNFSVYKLTKREEDVLSLFLEKKNTKEIAFELGLAEISVRKHFTSLYRKFRVSCREELLFLLCSKNLA